MVALNFLSIAAGTAAAGTLAGYYTPAKEVSYFGITGAIAVVLAVVLAAASPWIRTMMRGVP